MKERKKKKKKGKFVRPGFVTFLSGSADLFSPPRITRSSFQLSFNDLGNVSLSDNTCDYIILYLVSLRLFRSLNRTKFSAIFVIIYNRMDAVEWSSKIGERNVPLEW